MWLGPSRSEEAHQTNRIEVSSVGTGRLSFKRAIGHLLQTIPVSIFLAPSIAIRTISLSKMPMGDGMRVFPSPKALRH